MNCKRFSSRVLSFLLAVCMVLTGSSNFNNFKKTASAASERVNIGSPECIGFETITYGGSDVKRAIYNFNDTLELTGDTIKSVSIQFTSPAQEGVESIDYDGNGGADFQMSSLTTDNHTHIIINSTSGNALSADKWLDLLRNHIKIYVRYENIRSVMVSISDEVDMGQENLIEFNELNGHYYELVDEKTNWGTARQTALNSDSMGSKYESYLVNITSSQENRFIYSICRTTTWIGTTCDPEAKIQNRTTPGSADSKDPTKGTKISDIYEYSSVYSADSNNMSYWFYSDGPEAGKLMTYGTTQWSSDNTMTMAAEGTEVEVGASKVKAQGGFLASDVSAGYNNWANNALWESSILYEPSIPVMNNNEPNNQGSEYYMVVYSRDDINTYSWIIPSMWNDYNANSSTVGSYIIEYSLIDSTDPDDTLDDKQSSTDLDGKGDKVPKTDGVNFMISEDDAKTALDATILDLSKASSLTGDGDTTTTSVKSGKSDLNNAVAGDEVSIVLQNGSDATVTKTVTATVYDNVTTGKDKDSNPAQIGSNDFSVPGGKNATLLSVDDIVSKGDVKVLVNGNDAVISPIITDADLKKVNDAIKANVTATVPVTVTDNNTGLSTVVDITIIPTEVGETVTAHDILITKDEADEITPDVITDKSDAVATDNYGNDTEPVLKDAETLITFIKSQDPGTIIPATYTNGEATPADINITILDNVTNSSDPDKNSQIGSVDYEVPALSAEETQGSVLEKGKITALDNNGKKITITTSNTTVDAADLTALNKAISDNKQEDVVVTLHVTNNANNLTTVVNVTVKPVSVIPSASPSVAPSEAPSEAPSAAPSEDPSEAPSAAPSEKPSEAPSAAPSENPSEAPSAAPSASPSVDPGLDVINAHDIIVPVSDKPLDTDDIIDKSDAESSKGNPVTPDKDEIVVDKPTVTSVTLKDGEAPDKEIKVYVKDEVNDNSSDPLSETKITIGANNFSIPIADAANPSDELLKKLAQAVAVVDGVNVDISDITVPQDKMMIEPKDGIYDVTFKYGDTEVTVKATVKDEGEIKTIKDNDSFDDDVNLTGNNFNVKIGSDPLTPDTFADKANIRAVDGTGADIPYTVNPDDLASLNNIIKNGPVTDSVPVKVTAGDKVITVNVKVYDADSNEGSKEVPGQKTKTGYDVENIYANDFTVTADELAKILSSDSDALTTTTEKAKANAYLEEQKTPVAITKVEIIKSSDNEYNVTFKTDNGTNTTVKMSVKDSTDADVTGQDKIYEKTNPQNVVEKITPNKDVDTVTINGTVIPKDKYTVNKDTGVLTIDKSYVHGLDNGVYDVVVSYTSGTPLTFKLTVKDYDETTIVKNPPLFTMYKEVIRGNKFTLNLQGISKNAIVTYKSKKPRIAPISKKGVITGKRIGITYVTCRVIQNGSYYNVRVKVKVLKKHKGASKNYNLNKKALVKAQGTLPEYNVYKRIIKKKKTRIAFTSVEGNAKVKFYIDKKYKKERKYLKIGKITKNKKKKKMSCVITGRKKGWVHLTARITQHGKTYYTRLLVRIDDRTWTAKQLKKYLK